ncbi:hypothetical protein FHS96_000116 [Sphingomonas zeicaulis]|uniref:hypothetical protein n=1 Tax=Sphingomonas zeicaulis TaxID=1632740 RepID=UPI003D1E934D
MGHHLTAIIGRHETVAALVRRLGAPDPVALDFDLLLVPLDEDRLDAIAMSREPRFDGFTYLSPTMARAMGDALGAGRALYLETDYFGGIGGQGAALFEDGASVWRGVHSSKTPQPSTSPISEGLAALGVIAEAGGDAFDRLGLAGFRSLDRLGFE